MLGKNNKLNNEIIRVLDNLNSGSLDVRIDPDAIGNDKEIAVKLNSYFDEATKWKQSANYQLDANEEIRGLISYADEGQLETRISADKFEGDTKELVKSVNDLLDSIEGPFVAAYKYVARISNGDIPEKITREYKGTFNEFKTALNTCVDSINALSEDSAMLAEAGMQGRVDARADTSRHNGEFKQIVEGMNNTLDAISKPMNESTDILLKLAVNDFETSVEGEYNGIFKDNSYAVNEVRNRLLNIQRTFEFMAKGDFSDLPKYKQAGKRSENDKLLPYTVGLMETVKGMANEFIELGHAAEEGELNYRANSSSFEGMFNEAITTVNEAFDALVNPLTMTADYVDRISKGDIPEKITAEYNGDFNSIKYNLNQCVDAVQALIEDSEMLSEAAINQQFDVRADVTKHNGDFRKVVEGVNKTLDTIVTKIYWYNTIIDSIPFPVSVTDMDMNWTFLNKNVEELTGLKREDVLGSNCLHAQRWK